MKKVDWFEYVYSGKGDFKSAIRDMRQDWKYYLYSLYGVKYSGGKFLSLGEEVSRAEMKKYVIYFWSDKIKGFTELNQRQRFKELFKKALKKAIDYVKGVE